MPNALTIGTFDGVHLGHQELIHRCAAHAEQRHGKAIVLAFDPHPMTLLRPQSAPPRLLTWERKEQLLREAGAHEVVRLEPTTDLLSKTGDEFLTWLFTRFDPSLIVEGPDFHYGKGRDGNIQTLINFAASHRCSKSSEQTQVEIVPAIEVVLGDHQYARASSTLIRWLITQGRVSDAARVLGRPYELEGTVVQGDRKGRTINIPTCNLATQCLLPLDGVYAGHATLPTGQTFPAAIAVGARPTVGGLQRRAEVHILRENKTAAFASSPAPQSWSPLHGVPEYNWFLRVELRSFVRDEVKFPTFDHLRQQIGRDLARVRSLV